MCKPGRPQPVPRLPECRHTTTSRAVTSLSVFPVLHKESACIATLSRMLVEATILLAVSRHNGTNVLRETAALYKVDTESINTKVKQEFAAKARAKKDPKPVPKAKKAA
jgi:hypothetical protein